MSNEDARLSQSLADVKEDLACLAFITKTGGDRLRAFQALLLGQDASFSAQTRQLILTTLRPVVERYQALSRALETCLNEKSKDVSAYEQKLLLKRHAAEELRSLQMIAAGMMTAGDWQSPSYDHALFPRAGRQTGKIRGTFNDYTRDHHRDAEDYERHFARAYIDGLAHPLVRALVTSSGMAAFSTALACIQTDMGADDCVCVSDGIYFQNKKILIQQFGKRIQWVDENNLDQLLEVAREREPRAFFFDTLGNTPAMMLPNFEKILAALSSVVKRPAYLVLDNSARATTFQPLQALPLFSKLSLLVIESLNKYYQFGFDRVTGGVVWATGRVAGRLFTTRMHLGTNISDVSTLALIEPHRAFLDDRLARIGRNVLFLASALDLLLQSFKDSELSHVVYPGLPSHPSFAWAQKKSFCGGYFILQFKPAFARVSCYERFLTTLMKLARKRKIDLVAGTSFGFDTTRVYLTARHASKECQPFVRISVGTETRLELECLKELFIDVIQGHVS